MDRLKFYNIDDKYIDYLYQFDDKVPYNKNQKDHIYRCYY